MITESKVKDGTLTLGTTPTTVDLSCQVTNVRINSSYDDDGDAQETLCGDVLTPGRKLGGRSLAGTFIQDWTATTSITEFLWDHDLEVLAFEYVPNAVDAPTITGSVLLEVPSESYGGDVNARLVSDFEWQITTPVVRTPPVTAMAASSTA